MRLQTRSIRVMAIVAAVGLGLAAAVSAQEAGQQPSRPPAHDQHHQKEQPDQTEPAPGPERHNQDGQHRHDQPAAPGDQHAGHGAHASLFDGRDTAGTGWAPIATPMLASHRQLGSWSTMLMGNGFLAYMQEFAPEHRGAHQANSTSWLMGMARRPAWGGVVGGRFMLSAEPFTVPGCGYPDLLATGEQCDGDGIHDRQHPHDLVMELAAEYSRPLARGIRWHVYGGPAGEPALGPVAFPHRASAMANVVAPVSHHWLDATHITFGVATAGLTGARWRAEASVFNGREPDERRWDLDFGRMDSVSVRLQLAPSDRLALQLSAGHLEEAEAGEGSLPRRDVERVTASAMYQGTVGGRPAAWMLGWGANTESGARTHSALAEASVALTPTHTLFGRAEIAGKSGHDLHIHEAETTTFTVGKLQAGYLRLLAPRGGLQAGLGGSVTASIVPPALRPRYGGTALGIAVYATVRPTVAR